MTIGELAKLFNEEKKIDADLTVIPMRGWLRGDWFDSTGAMWINPSPNIRNLDQATLYPGVALIEGTSVSVGRGTDMPFQLVGSPYFLAKELASLSQRPQHRRSALRAHHVHSDVGTVRAPRVLGCEHHCHQSRATGRAELGLELAAALHKLSPLGYDLGKMNQLLVNQAVFTALQAGQDPHRIQEDWQDQLDEFMDVRQKYLMY